MSCGTKTMHLLHPAESEPRILVQAISNQRRIPARDEPQRATRPWVCRHVFIGGDVLLKHLLSRLLGEMISQNGKPNGKPSVLEEIIGMLQSAKPAFQARLRIHWRPCPVRYA